MTPDLSIELLGAALVLVALWLMDRMADAAREAGMLPHGQEAEAGSERTPTGD